MKTLSKAYSDFCSLLEEGTNVNLSYRSLCRLVKVSPADLDEILLEELGYRGEELLTALRTPAHA